MTKILHLAQTLGLAVTLFLEGCIITANCPVDNDGDGIVSGWRACSPDEPGAESVWSKEDSEDLPPEGDCDDSNPGVYPGAPEICDGLDNDCDDAVDEGAEQIWYIDADHDGYGHDDLNYTYQGCEAPGWVLNNTDCDDGEVNVYPGALELCDGLDNDCDEFVDNNGDGSCTQ